jgi:hypothetical protein
MSYKPGIIERYEKLFAIISMEKGFITPDTLIKALTTQVKEHAQNGKYRFVRKIFLEDHIMSVQEIDEVCAVVFQQTDLRIDEPLPIQKNL